MIIGVSLIKNIFPLTGLFKKKKKKQAKFFLDLYSLESNFLYYLWQIEIYQNELEEMNNMNRQEYVAHLRRYKHLLTCYYWSEDPLWSLRKNASSNLVS